VSHPQSHRSRSTTLWVAPLICILLASTSLTAQQGIGFESSFGYQSLSGEYGDVLKGGVDAEFSVVWTRTKFRYGIGMDWASYHQEPPFGSESWSNIVSFFGVTFFPWPETRLRPFIQLRAEGRRLRPEGDHLTEVEPPEEGENTSEIRVDGWSGAFLLGADVRMTDRWWAKVAGYYSKISTQSADLGEIDLGTFDAGNVVGLRVGLFWTP